MNLFKFAFKIKSNYWFALLVINPLCFKACGQYRTFGNRSLAYLYPLKENTATTKAGHEMALALKTRTGNRR